MKGNVKDLLIILLIASILIIVCYNKSFNKYDVNKDGEVNAKDYLLIQKYILYGEE